MPMPPVNKKKVLAAEEKIAPIFQQMEVTEMIVVMAALLANIARIMQENATPSCTIPEAMEEASGVIKHLATKFVSQK